MGRSGTTTDRTPRRVASARLAARLLARAPRWGFVLDHDGTLVPFRRNPAHALPSARARRAVARLLAAGHPVCIVSGRPLRFLQRAWPLPGLALAGSHGLERAWERDGAGQKRTASLRRAARRLERRVRRALGEAPRSLSVERKPFGVALHLRPLPPRLRDRWWTTCTRALRAALPPGYRLLRGALVVEARPRAAHKGRVPEALRRAATRWRHLPLCAAGDDRTDEDLFAAVGPHDVAVLVSRTARPSAASVRVAGVGELLDLLERIAGGGKE